jgi:flagellar motor switch protein FliG
MGVYTRYKKDPGGFRKLVELLEVTPKDKRDKMIEIGVQEDAEYTKRALSFCYNFLDILNLPDAELAEVLGISSPRTVAMAFSASGPGMHEKVLKLSPRQSQIEIKDLIEATYKPNEVGGAQFKIIEATRQLERRGKVMTKRIPADV